MRDTCPAFILMGTHNRVVAVDLDDTLLSGKFPEVGQPLPSVVSRMWRLKEIGFRIIIHTARICPGREAIREEQLEAIHAVLHVHEIPYDEIWTGAGKPIACAYIDDKSYPSVAAFLEKMEREIGRE